MIWGLNKGTVKNNRQTPNNCPVLLYKIQSLKAEVATIPKRQIQGCTRGKSVRIQDRSNMVNSFETEPCIPRAGYTLLNMIKHQLKRTVDIDDQGAMLTLYSIGLLMLFRVIHNVVVNVKAAAAMVSCHCTGDGKDVVTSQSVKESWYTITRI